MMNSIAGDFFGGFADVAILFPLLFLLGTKVGFSIPLLFLTAGITYIAAGLYFKVPISVQPLKSLVIMGAAISATKNEIQVAAVCLGLILLFLNYVKISTVFENVPENIVHQIQVGLGVLLVYQGMAVSNINLTLVFILVFLLIFIEIKKWFPVMGVFAVGGVMYGMTHQAPLQLNESLNRLSLLNVVSLLLPQVLLTLANSVIATENVCYKYFGNKAFRVNVPNLLKSIGFGNVLFGVIGGMPFCHGSGGVTAHVKGGAKSFRACFGIGIFLLFLSLWFNTHKNSQFWLPPLVISILLLVTGFFHLGLARQTWTATRIGKIKLLMAALIAVSTQNLILVLVSAGVFLLFEQRTFFLKRSNND